MTKGKLYELCSEWNLKQDEHVCPEAIQRYIDEAKKDFPLILEAPIIKSKTTCGDITTDIFAVAEWFKKWFGEDDES